MFWILVALISGSLVTGQFNSEEECRGRGAMLEKADRAGASVREGTALSMAGGYKCIYMGGSTVIYGSSGTFGSSVPLYSRGDGTWVHP